MQELSLERGLAAYDMFVLHDGKGDFEEASPNNFALYLCEEPC